MEPLLSARCRVRHLVPSHSVPGEARTTCTAPEAAQGARWPLQSGCRQARELGSSTPVGGQQGEPGGERMVLDSRGRLQCLDFLPGTVT